MPKFLAPIQFIQRHRRRRRRRRRRCHPSSPLISSYLDPLGQPDSAIPKKKPEFFKKHMAHHGSRIILIA